MKKFLIAVIVLLVIGLAGFYSIYFKGFYLDFDPQAEIQTIAKVDQKTIQIKKGNNYEPFTIKGVDLPSSKAGYYSTDYAISKSTYKRWFKLIQEMGANTIRIYTIYDDTFYNALYEYNQNNDEPLYLLQGIQVSDDANNSTNDAYSKDFYYTLRDDAIDVVDVIHGQKIIMTNKMKGSGMYRNDVSKWTLGYLIGNEWNSEVIKYTDKSDYSNEFTGTYFTTTEDATNFETLLAKVMDSLISYENDKYKTQSLITFASSPDLDPFEYDEYYARQIGKYVSLDGERIKPTQNLASGYFVSYKLYDYCPGFVNYFSAQQLDKLQGIISNLDTSRYYEGYCQLLQEYHSLPVVISGFGYSSSRGTDNIEGPISESQQGELLVSTYNDIVASGCSGAFIDSWQDCWDKRTWNTSYAVDLNEIYRWNDIQSDSTGYGLLAFDSNDILIDGNIDDWPDQEVIYQDDKTKLLATSDEKGIYLFLQRPQLKRDEKLYFPIDITSNSGSNIDFNSGLTFNREADFLVHLNGLQSRILVQARYESLRENYLEQISGINPFVNYPNKNDNGFVAIAMLTDNKTMVEDYMSEEEKVASSRYKTYETGKLKESNYDVDNYDTLTDFAYGENCVELRIPWQILNFYNPYDKMIHDDYYDRKYGVEGISIDNIYIGVSDNNKQVSLNKFKLPDLNDLKFKERLKQSYQVVKNSWGDQND